jgi:Ner family transcriptional regulator
MMEVRERGKTLAELSREAGLSPTACSNALRMLSYPSAEKVIARFLRRSAYSLWPERYNSNGARKKLNYHNSKNTLNTQCLNEVAG